MGLERWVLVRTRCRAKISLAAVVVASAALLAGAPWESTARAAVAPVAPNEFTLVALPDTQHYFDDVTHRAFSAQTQWIVENTCLTSPS